MAWAANRDLPDLPPGSGTRPGPPGDADRPAGGIVASPLTESIQLRVTTSTAVPEEDGGGLREDPKRAAPFELEMRRVDLLSRRAGGLRDVSGERDFVTGMMSSRSDEFEADRRGTADQLRPSAFRDWAPRSVACCASAATACPPSTARGASSVPGPSTRGTGRAFAAAVPRRRDGSRGGRESGREVEGIASELVGTAENGVEVARLAARLLRPVTRARPAAIWGHTRTPIRAQLAPSKGEGTSEGTGSKAASCRRGSRGAKPAGRGRPRLSQRRRTRRRRPPPRKSGYQSVDLLTGQAHVGGVLPI